MTLASVVLIALYIAYCGTVVYYSEDREIAAVKFLASVAAGLLMMLLIRSIQ